jgi:hypothetical protein
MRRIRMFLLIVLKICGNSKICPKYFKNITKELSLIRMGVSTLATIVIADL